jgi:hypothetical protein
MNNEFDNLYGVLYAFLFLVIVLFLVSTYAVIFQYPKLAEKTCKELKLELFDYSSGNMFKQESIICINKSNNQILKIK